MLDINKVTAAVAHFTAADADDLFDALVRNTTADEFHHTEAAKDVTQRYFLTEEELLLFRELCLKIVDIATVIEPPFKKNTIDMRRVAAGFNSFFSADGDIQVAHEVLEYGSDAILAGYTEDETMLLRALLMTVTEVVDIDEPFVQDN